MAKDFGSPSPSVAVGVVYIDAAVVFMSCGESCKNTVVVYRGKCYLAKVVGTDDSPRGHSNGLHGGQEQSDQYSNDRDDNEQLDDCEAVCTS